MVLPLIQIVAFSRRRPLQLAGYLTSLFANCQGEPDVSLLARFDEQYRSAYGDVLKAFPQVIPWHEDDFVTQLSMILDSATAEFTMFGCDDALFASHFEPDAIAHVMDGKPELLGISLRLGQNIHADMFGQPLPQPEFSDLTWDMTAPTSTGDWAYPWEVLGTVYRTEFVKKMVAGLGARSPSQLEERGSHQWSKYTDLHHMASYPTSRLVVPTVNVIQQEFPGNGIRGDQALSPEFLLECWNNGLRMDTERYRGMAPDSWRVGEFYLKRAE